MFVAGQPIGQRCTHAAHSRISNAAPNDWEEVDAAVQELARLKAKNLDSRLTPYEHTYYLTEYRKLYEKAKRAALVPFAESAPKRPHDVKNVPLERAHYLLELKPRAAPPRKPEAPPLRLLRVYFAEPAHDSSLLLILEASTKEDSKQGNAEQTAAMRRAVTRANNYEFDRSRSRAESTMKGAQNVPRIQPKTS